MMLPAQDREDLRDRDDVEALVSEFYRRAFADHLLGPVFVDIARMDVRAHLPIMCDFWQTVLFRAGTYRRNAFTVHLDLHQRVDLTSAHFARWLVLWTETVDDMYAGPAAGRAKVQAARIADSIHRRLHSTTDAQPLTVGAARTRSPGSRSEQGKGTRLDGFQRPPIARNSVNDHRNGCCSSNREGCLDEHL